MTRYGERDRSRIPSFHLGDRVVSSVSLMPHNDAASRLSAGLPRCPRLTEGRPGQVAEPGRGLHCNSHCPRTEKEPLSPPAHCPPVPAESHHPPAASALSAGPGSDVNVESRATHPSRAPHPGPPKGALEPAVKRANGRGRSLAGCSGAHWRPQPSGGQASLGHVAGQWGIQAGKASAVSRRPVTWRRLQALAHD
ncbi:translation initiation factor IF-2-like [Fukomys damarensis]|uniref:translation initiation factor IF-2-like n=1 Tax=Fukomys damarensis TaxID=885580 RepID=UPI001455CADD|nr:translation initiation factor IF-2-like [Fukomys damarensis]